MNPLTQALRFEVSPDLSVEPCDQLVSREVLKPPAPVRRKSKVWPTTGSIRIPYQEYRNTSGKYWMLFYYRAGRRVREARSDFEKLKKRCEEVANDIANGQAAMLAFTEADRAGWLRCHEILAAAGIKKTLELVASEYVENWKAEQDAGVSAREALLYYKEQHPSGLIPRNIPKIAEEFLQKKVVGKKWRRILTKMLQRFSAHFTGPLGSLQTRDIDDWLDSLAGGLRTRRNYLNVLKDLAEFAKTRGYLPKHWEGLQEVSNPKPPIAAVDLYTPDELVRLLNLAEKTKAGRKLVPLIAITAFAGVRHGEMHEEKIECLDWSDIDWEAKTIYVGHGAAKTGRDRVVDMPDNLVAWIETYRRPRGKICPLANTSNALCRLRTKAGIGRKRNGLRKSFISYKLALTRNIDGVADQAGNSASIIRKNYKRAGTRMRAEAERWFAIAPVRAEVLPLFAWAKR